MELRQLKYFLKAKEFSNFTEAAQQLYISQSTLSQQIKQLEEELGIPLFNRTGKRVTITEAGILFAEYAEKSLKASKDGLLLMKDLNNIRTGSLKIGLTWGLKPLLLLVFEDFTKKHPLLKLKVTFGTTEELIEELIKQNIDFALTFYEAHESEALKYEPLFRSSMTLVVGDNSPLAAKKSVTLKELENIKLALPAQGFSTRKYLDEQFRKYKISPDIAIEINDSSSLMELVQLGSFATILTGATLTGSNGLKTIPIRGHKMLREAVIIKLRDTYEKRAALAFKELLFDICKDKF